MSDRYSWDQEGRPKILLYENRKADPVAWPYTTTEEKRAAVLGLFRLLDEEWQCYYEMTSKHEELYNKAKTGDADAAHRLLQLRINYEYEEYRIIDLKRGSHE